MKKLLSDLKKTAKFYKSLRKKSNPQKPSEKITVRPDVYAFLTCPEPLLESEKSPE